MPDEIDDLKESLYEIEKLTERVEVGILQLILILIMVFFLIAIIGVVIFEPI